MTPLIRLTRRPLIAAVVGVLASSISLSPASATNLLGHDAGDSNIYFTMCQLDATTHATFHDNDNHDINSTQITSINQHTCSEIDVFITDGAYGTDDPTGWWECHVWFDGNTCDKGHVHINISYSNIPEDYNRTLTLMCEEVGHSVGLDHSGATDSCMSANLSALHLNPHDRAHLDALY